MRVVVGFLFGILLGFVAGYVVAVAGGIAYGEIAQVSQREGAYAMGVVFGFGPLGGALGALGGMVLGMRWAIRPRPAEPGPAAPE